jgi:hypothetical protein
VEIHALAKMPLIVALGVWGEGKTFCLSWCSVPRNALSASVAVFQSGCNHPHSASSHKVPLGQVLICQVDSPGKCGKSGWSLLPSPGPKASITGRAPDCIPVPE